MARVAPYRSWRYGEASCAQPGLHGGEQPDVPQPPARRRTPADAVRLSAAPARPAPDQPVRGRDRQAGALGELGGVSRLSVPVEGPEQRQRPAGSAPSRRWGVARHGSHAPLPTVAGCSTAAHDEGAPDRRAAGDGREAPPSPRLGLRPMANSPSGDAVLDRAMRILSALETRPSLPAGELIDDRRAAADHRIPAGAHHAGPRPARRLEPPASWSWGSGSGRSRRARRSVARCAPPRCPSCMTSTRWSARPPSSRSSTSMGC